ncbi:FAD-dependent oxidoreductase [Auritidibacter ignavus]|uniref:FAD-dependent oxidoreductase n=1 Tax=Auritidibacter ignavus TaxID=678932 RepID=UPI000F032B91|nr:FAD-dependent oxidoreductase [Auritidibacter ignavus]NIH71995.1 3-phenylpropionate/trans-cinnamate dioxygenase ferredoxin reductase subunit [Auritidibacter ignavus]RMX23981.1 FAD-dependent oxidoreductase [Auritidibacter ignavus]WGH86013.1 FAD-dependent oxidoreductase [Auritidibacter ignavus]WGH88299.1 FAD-dependent oxidoreductase [Auritidibacter ignavus]WHS34163.1 FAD-dependent oxidoreductase [Auritidibacter ignavus]
MSAATEPATPGSVAIIGGSVAGFTAAHTLRERGYAGAITVIDPNPYPYDRPPVSGDYLTGALDEPGLRLGGAHWAEQHQIRWVQAVATELHLGHRRAEQTAGSVATAATRSTHLIRTGDGQQLSAEVVILATGASPAPFEHSLADQDGEPLPVLTVRDHTDVDRIRQLITSRAEESHSSRPLRIGVAGAGLLAAELAAGVHQLGAAVRLYQPHHRQAAEIFGDTIAELLDADHARHGVELIQQYLQADALPEGFTAQTDLVLAAVGTVPNTQLAEQAGLPVTNGVAVDDRQRVDGVSGVYAIGDLTPGAKHWDQAVRSAQRAVADLLDTSPTAEPDQVLPKHNEHHRVAPRWIWTDRYDTHAGALGEMALAARPGYQLIERWRRPIHEDESTLQGSAASGGQRREHASFVLDPQHRLCAVAALNQPMVLRAATRLMQRGIVIDPVDLADPDLNLRSLIRNR